VYRHRIIEIRCLESRGGVDSSRSGGVGKGGGDSIIIASSGLNPSTVLVQRDRAIGGQVTRPHHEVLSRRGPYFSLIEIIFD
jgi:hypothetical protein